MLNIDFKLHNCLFSFRDDRIGRIAYARELSATEQQHGTLRSLACIKITVRILNSCKTMLYNEGITKTHTNTHAKQFDPCEERQKENLERNANGIACGRLWRENDYNHVFWMKRARSCLCQCILVSFGASALSLSCLRSLANVTK